MTAVSCPTCHEYVRLPTLELPGDSSIECPWCRQRQPTEYWMSQLPPLARIFAADGRLLEETSFDPDEAPSAADEEFAGSPVIAPVAAEPSDVGDAETVRAPDLSSPVDQDAGAEVQPVATAPADEDAYESEEFESHALEFQKKPEPPPEAFPRRVPLLDDPPPIRQPQKFSSPPRTWGRQDYKLRRRRVIALSVLFAATILGYLGYTVYQLRYAPAVTNRSPESPNRRQADRRQGDRVQDDPGTRATEQPGTADESAIPSVDETFGEPADEAPTESGEDDVDDSSDSDPRAAAPVVEVADPVDESEAEEPFKEMPFGDVLDQLKKTEAARANDLPSGDEPPRMTAEMRARENLAKRKEQQRQQSGAADRPPRNDIDRSLLVFPSDAPSPNDVRPTDFSDRVESSDSEADSAPDMFDVSALENVAPEQVRDNAAPDASAELAADAEQPELQSDALPTLPPPNTGLVLPGEDDTPATEVAAGTTADTTNPIDSSELTDACDEAIRSIERLTSETSADDTLRQVLVARLLAFKNVSQVASLPIPANSEAVEKLFETLRREDVREKIGTLGSEWIGWSRRDTDGILLDGTLEKSGTELRWMATDGTQYDVELATEWELPVDTRCVALGRILTTKPSPRIRLVTGVVVP